MMRLQEIQCLRKNRADDVFIACVGVEERCLGAVRRLGDYRFEHGYILFYDQPDPRRDTHLKEMRRILRKYGRFEEIPTSEEDPVDSISTIKKSLRSLNMDKRDSVITVDITAIAKPSILLLLRAIDDLKLWEALRLLYTEPREYVVDMYMPLSIGMKQIKSVSGFVAEQALNQRVLLVIFLGYEGDRAMALYEDLDPDETVLIIPKPAYHEEWEGRTERLNQNLISLLGDDKLWYADSRDPVQVFNSLENLLGPVGRYDFHKWNCCIAPLGTKPQTVGLYLFCRKHVGKEAITYAHSLQAVSMLEPRKVGRTWSLPLK